ncbi:MAG: L-fucose/L-arabinose isomerase family protein [Spirochaetia bacterium]
MNKPRVVLATITETREDFRAKRSEYVEEERKALDWIKQAAEVYESEVLTSVHEVRSFADDAARRKADALITHIPVWTEPVLTLKLSELIPLPLALLGNGRKETSSMVGILGAGGALDQIGKSHWRIMDHRLEEERRELLAFVRAASARQRLKGQTMGMFGGRSLGMITATADAAQWHTLFGVDIEHVDQMEIVRLGEAADGTEVNRHVEWLTRSLGAVEFGGSFTEEAMDRQVRSYLATMRLSEERGFDFVGVKCQPELSDGYTSQCVAHMLMNGHIDADGPKEAVIHACEADADGALTMQLLHLISGGSPAALLDLRLYDTESGFMTLANCGALPAVFAAPGGADHASADRSRAELTAAGLTAVNAVPHVFGKGGGCALPCVITGQEVTLARLSRVGGEYWMAIVAGRSEDRDRSELEKTTPEFPQGFVRVPVDKEFFRIYGSNHIHMVLGDYVAELEAFCRLSGIRYTIWREE